MVICKYFIWFILYSFLGWIWETSYCTIRAGRWENRGFLFGPVVPIYGFGAVAASMVFGEIASNLNLTDAPWWQVFIISSLGSIVLEYLTSWALEKIFHARWWDYSDKPLNINGRVCLPYTLGFGLAGLIVVFLIYPNISSLTADTHPLMLEFCALLFMFLTGMDVSLTLSALTGFTRNMVRIDEEINTQMEAYYESLLEKSAERKEAIAEKKEAIFEKREEFAEARELRRHLTEEKIAALMKSTNAFDRARLSQVRDFRREGNALELRKKAAEHLPKIHLIKKKEHTPDNAQ